MADAVCQRRNIPDHLHRNGREVVDQFEDGELLFRRLSLSQSDWKTRVRESIKFDHDGMSLNRGKLSKADDVRWNPCRVPVTEPTYIESEIVGFRAIDFRMFSYKPEDGPNVEYTIIIKHDPKRCMYPHALAVILKNGVPQTKIKSKKLKLEIRIWLAEFAQRS